MIEKSSYEPTEGDYIYWRVRGSSGPLSRDVVISVKGSAVELAPHELGLSSECRWWPLSDLEIHHAERSAA